MNKKLQSFYESIGLTIDEQNFYGTYKSMPLFGNANPWGMGIS